MVRTLLAIRTNQVKRFLWELGVVRSILIVGVIIVAFIAIWIQLQSTLIAWVIVIAYTFSILNLQLSRPDKKFLKLIHPNPQLILVVEYLCLSIPLLILFVLKGYFFQSFSIILIPFLLSFLKASISLKFKFQFEFSFIPATAFEWKVGLRQNLIVILTTQLLGLYFYQFQVSFFITILLISIIVSSFYLEMESLLMLESQLKILKQPYYLAKKIGTSFLLFWVCTLPLSIVFMIFHFNFWYLLLGTWLLSLLLFTFAILIKYAFYEEGKDQKFILGTLQAIAIIFLIIPFVSGFPTPILLLLMSIYFFRKTQKNLQEYAVD